MKFIHVVVLAMLLLCSCADHASEIGKSTQEAEVAASRAEASANAAATVANRAAEAAKGAEQATGDAAEQLRRAEDMAQRLCDVCDVCSQGSGPAVRRFLEYTKIQYAACSAPWPPPVKTQTK
jgi:ABC-type phosphate transport system substrate-binding protein